MIKHKIMPEEEGAHAGGRKGGTIRLQTVDDLKSLNSSFSSSNSYIRAFRAQLFEFVVVRAYPLIEIRQTVPLRAIRGESSDSRQQYLSQQYPPPLLNKVNWINIA